MKEPLSKTKVVIRHLPPSVTQSFFFSQIDERFSDRYNWFSFRLGKSSHKHQIYSRAYISFKRPEDVFEFAEFFDGHVFVNEKGTQFKAIVEYAPSQLVPKPSTKKDGREGTIFKDPDYLEFLKLIAKPVENLPSAEIQLERKEAELSGAPKETPVVTPLMEFVRQKRAAKSGAQGSVTTRKVGRKIAAMSAGKPGTSSKRSEKKKYIQKDSAKGAKKSNFFVASKQEDQSVTSVAKELRENGTVCGIDGPVTGITFSADSGKKKILLLKPKDREAPNVPEGVSEQQGASSPAASTPGSTASRQGQRRKAGGKLIRSILLRNEAGQNQSSAAAQPQQKTQAMSPDTVKKPPQPTNTRMGSGSEKHEKRTRNKDRPDRGHSLLAVPWKVPIRSLVGAQQPIILKMMDLSCQVRSSPPKEEVLQALEPMRNKFGFRNHPQVLRESNLKRVLNHNPFDPISGPVPGTILFVSSYDCQEQALTSNRMVACLLRNSMWSTLGKRGVIGSSVLLIISGGWKGDSTG
ncbi:hypothetical protein V6N13_016599 [Hibiscus sabdariffa]|uniref:UPF3 domain-containing protein n=1 Tax=Hibiscus sabdariffa TaxID=183260 RepID=A0ABR2NN08_9ROSI